MFEGGEMGGSFSIGKLFYKMRMKKPIDLAIKWFEKNKSLGESRDPT